MGNAVSTHNLHYVHTIYTISIYIYTLSMFARWATLQYGLAMILTSWLPVVVVLLHSSLPLARPKQGLASGRLTSGRLSSS